MRGVGDLKFHYRILIAVGVDNGVLGVGATLGKNHIVVGHVFEHDESVVFGMDSFFHFDDFFAVLNSGFINDWLKKYTILTSI